MLFWLWTTTPSAACGGFFCSGGQTTYTQTAGYTVPVVQSSERILFRVNPDETVTTFVEVAYQQEEDIDFAWVIPIPEPIDPAAVSTASADLFNALEAATAPTFNFSWPEVRQIGGYGSYGYGYGSGSSGCDLGCAGSTSTKGSTSSSTATITGETSVTIGVQVVADSVVGPFAIEVITATDADAFAAWLEAHGYDLPDGAVEPLQHYIASGMAFLGVQLAPDVPAGPIDTLQFTYPETEPMIPIILTRIASTSEVPIIAYLLADEPHGPTNWEELQHIAPSTTPDCDGGVDYLENVGMAIDAVNGLGFELEYAQHSESVPPLGDDALDALVRERGWLVRWRGSIEPDQMVIDPGFSADPGVQVFSNVHDIDLPVDPCPTDTRNFRQTRPDSHAPRMGSAFPVLLFAAWWRRRRPSPRA